MEFKLASSLENRWKLKNQVFLIYYHSLRLQEEVSKQQCLRNEERIDHFCLPFWWLSNGSCPLLILLLIDVEFKGEWSTHYIDKGRRYRLEIGLPNIHEVRGGGTIVFITGWLGLNSECMYYGKGFA